MYTKEEADNKIKEFKLKNTKKISEDFIDKGRMNIHITMLVYDTKEEDFADAIVKIPDEFLMSDSGKNMFAEIAPFVMGLAATNNKVPLCFSWASEAWIRVMKDENNGKVPENWKDHPKEEVLIVYYETEELSEMDCFDINRDGKKIDSEGDLIDSIELTENEKLKTKDGGKLQGRFTEIFKKYKDLMEDL